ncbi:carbon storage regulator [Legionella sp. 28fT52]|uniref:carbon storage regulator n=1 Tax=Legionella sp. 28fT52 TaxID=3410134 RepID=UPI003AF4E3A9
MLIVTRRVGESIRIGDEIEVQIRAIEGNTVTIAILTERAMPVRGEIIHRLHGAKEWRLFRAANESRI